MSFFFPLLWDPLSSFNLIWSFDLWKLHHWKNKTPQKTRQNRDSVRGVGWGYTVIIAFQVWLMIKLKFRATFISEIIPRSPFFGVGGWGGGGLWVFVFFKAWNWARGVCFVCCVCRYIPSGGKGREKGIYLSLLWLLNTQLSTLIIKFIIWMIENIKIYSVFERQRERVVFLVFAQSIIIIIIIFWNKVWLKFVHENSDQGLIDAPLTDWTWTYVCCFGKGHLVAWVNIGEAPLSLCVCVCMLAF